MPKYEVKFEIKITGTTEVTASSECEAERFVMEDADISSLCESADIRPDDIEIVEVCEV